MEKRKDVQIYELAYSRVPYGFWDNSLYTPLQCGADRTNDDVCELKDNTGENISSKNFYYSETTGTYWIWKNAPKTDYIGQCQYRRRLKFDENYDFNRIFSNYRIIVSTPIVIERTLRKQMEVVHPQIDVNAFEEIVCNTYPEYSSFFDLIFNKGHVLFFSSSYIMKYEDFCNYCDFMFPILSKYAEKLNLNNEYALSQYVQNRLKSPYKEIMSKPIEYHMLIGGFLQERLFTTWILTHFRQNEIFKRNFEFMEKSAELRKFRA